MSSTPPRLPRPAGSVVVRPTRSMVRHWCVRCAYRRCEPRVCAMVRVPSVKGKDHRRIGRERKVLVSGPASLTCFVALVSSVWIC